MSAEHKRPLVAFILVALVCSSIVGQSVRSALLGNGMGLGILIPIAPAHLLDTIQASGSNGRYLDTPFLGNAISAVGDVPAADRARAGAGGARAGRRGRSQTWSRWSPPGPAPRPSRAHIARPRPGTRPRVHLPRPRDIGSPPPVPTGPTTLHTARDDLRCGSRLRQQRPARVEAGDPHRQVLRPHPGQGLLRRGGPGRRGGRDPGRRGGRPGQRRQDRGPAPPPCDRCVRRPGPGAGDSHVHLAGGAGQGAVRRGAGAGALGVRTPARRAQDQ